MLSATLKSILEPQKQKSFREKEVKEKMIQTLMDKLKNHSAYGLTNCNFKVPPFLLGYIPYKHESMTRYLKSKLFKEGFYVKENIPCVLYISWDIKDIQKVQDIKRKQKIKEINTSKTTSDLRAFASKAKLTY